MYVNYKKRHQERKLKRIERYNANKERIESLKFNFQVMVMLAFWFMIGYWWCTGKTIIEW